MELIAYIRLFKKWFWLIFLGMFLAGGAAFLYRSRQPDQYQAKVTILVGGFIAAPNPNYAEIQTGQDLAQTYAALARTTDILEATITAGNFPVSSGQLSAAMTTHVVPETSLLELRVTYKDPVLAADMANELANQLILNSPSNLTPDQQRQVELANAEIDRLNRELEVDRTLRSTVESQIQNTSDPALLDQYRSDLNTIAVRINATSGNIANFQSTVTSLQQRTNSLGIREHERITGTPLGSSVLMVTLLGAVVGGALAAGIALLIEYLDDTIHTAEEATQALSIPNLASISRFGKSRDKYAKRLITHSDPGSPVSEEYRTLRTNLLFSADGHAGCRAYIVTSAGPSEGKSVTAANLAVTMAGAGWQVLLIDADLRRPRIHEIFGLQNTVGLSTLLSPSDEEAPIVFERCVQETEIPGLSVMTSGHIPLNPTEVLGSITMQRRFQEFKQANIFDIMLFDTPPVLVVADGAVLASTIKIPVVMVIEAGETRRGAALKTKERLDQLKIEIAGTVLNSANPKEQGYGNGYSYYYYYSDKS
jgi:non-specific protein-tyrosine kinase